MKWSPVWQMVVFVGMVLSLIVAWSAPIPYRVDIGKWDEAYVTDFYAIEYGAGTSFRWSKPQSTLQLPGVGAGDYVLQLLATAPVDTSLTVHVAGKTHTVVVTSGFAPYRFPVAVPPTFTAPLTMTLTTTEPNTADRRLVGVAIDEIRLIPQGWHFPAPMAIGVAVLVWLALTLWLGVWRLPSWLCIAVSWVSVLAVVVVRADAYLVLSALGILVGLAWAVPRALALSPPWAAATSLVVVAGAIGVVWGRGSASWLVLWQLLALCASVALMHHRQQWWAHLAPWWRWWGVLLLLCMGWLGGAYLLIVALIVASWWWGRSGTLDRRWSAWWSAMYSIGPTTVRWLRGDHATPPVSTHSGRRFGLDVIRAFAIGCVLIGHASATLPYYPASLQWFPLWCSFVGVESFFVLSGWLIGGLIIDRLDEWSHPATFGRFLHRRWVRTILPYWLMLAVVAIGGWGGAQWHAISDYWFFTQNLWQAHPPYFFVAWSLSIEEWFYVVVAGMLSLWSIRTAPQRVLRTLLVLLIIVPFALRIWVVFNESADWESTLRQRVPLRLDALAIGVAAVWWWRSWTPTWPWRTWVTSLGIALAVGSVALFVVRVADVHTAWLPHLLLLSMTSSAIALLLPALAAWSPPHLNRLHRLVQWVAHISYPLYLLHLPWRLTIEELAGGVGDHWALDGLITLVYVLGALWLAHRWHVLLEQPLMRLRWLEPNLHTKTPAGEPASV